MGGRSSELEPVLFAILLAGASPSQLIDAMRKEIGSFLQYMRVERGASDHTLKSYREDLAALGRLPLRRRWRCPAPASITVVELRGFVSALHEAGYAKSSIARRLASVRSFFRFGQREGWLKANPGKALRNPRKSQKLPHWLSTDEVGQLLGAPQGNEPPAAARPRDSRNALFRGPAGERAGRPERRRSRLQGRRRPRPGQRQTRTHRSHRLARDPSLESVARGPRTLAADRPRPRSPRLRQPLRYAAHHAQRGPDARKIPPRNRPRPADVAPTRSATASPRTCSIAAPTSAASRSCWATRAW